MSSMLLRALACSLLLSALLPTSAAIAADSGALQISGAWARPMPPGARVGGGYVEIHNAGETARRLLGAESPRASSMEIHTMAEVDGVMRMRRLPEGIEIPAGATISLKPGAEHLMFFNPSPAFAEGETIPVSLRFDGDESVLVEFEVADRSGKPADTHAGH
jgi:copper(I)-binding protein